MNSNRHAAAALLSAVSLAAIAHAAPATVARMEAAPASATVDFEVFLPLRDKADLDKLLVAQQTKGSPTYHQWLTPPQFARRFGPTTASIARAKAALIAAGLTVTETHSRSFHVAGTAAQVARALGTPMNIATMTTGERRMVPVKPFPARTSVGGQPVTIVAFTTVPERHTNSYQVAAASADNRESSVGGYWYNDMKQAYDYPSYASILPNGKRLDGAGVRIAVVMSGDVSDSDVQAYFDHENFSTTTGLPDPVIDRFPVDGGPKPFPSGSSSESSLDVEQALGGAPGASVTLVGIPDLSDHKILDAYTAIVDKNRWDIVNSSFGGCELSYFPAYNNGIDNTGVLDTYHELFAQGNSEGITFVASSGDEAGLECPNAGAYQGQPQAYFVASVGNPADDPFVTAVGGGNLFTTSPPSPQTTPPTLTSNYVKEEGLATPEYPYDYIGNGTNVSGGLWGAGGGVSAYFGTPKWQNFTTSYGVTAQGRIMPDVGMQVGGCPGGISKPNCPETRSSAVYVAYRGHFPEYIGTSVSSPEFVGALALDEEANGGRQGNINPFLWSQGSVQDNLGGAQAAAGAQFYHKNQKTYDGVAAFSFPDGVGQPGFDYVFGNGSPDVRQLFGLTQYAPAGNPQTPSNP